jgi:hypothetical protein
MTDDDILMPGAITTIIEATRSDPSLIIVNSEVRNKDLSRVLTYRQNNIVNDEEYSAIDNIRFFENYSSYLSFIGCVIIKKDIWINRNRQRYYDSLFVHLGVIMQSPPMERIQILAKPCILIRYGNAMWTNRSFEIWSMKWPDLIWSFPNYDKKSKSKIVNRNPWKKLSFLVYYRAIGAFSEESLRLIRSRNPSKLDHFFAMKVSKMSPQIAMLVCFVYLIFFKRNIGLSDISTNKKNNHKKAFYVNNMISVERNKKVMK